MVFDFAVEDISASSHPTFSLSATFSQQDESSAFLQATAKEQTLSMPPKSVYPGGGQALLSHFAAWFDEAYFVHMLLNGYQREQVHFDGLWTFTTAAFLDALFPFRDQTFYPLPELVLFQRIFIAAVFTRPTTLPPIQEYCNFMLYTTIPEGLYQRLLQTFGSTRQMQITLLDIPWVGDFLNLCFNPRSSMLLFTFNLSICEVNGRLFEPLRSQRPITLGFRPTAHFWNTLHTGANSFSMWNRWRVDYFMRGTILTLQVPEAITLVAIHYAPDCYWLVDQLNLLFNNSHTFQRWMHMPIRPEVGWNFHQHPEASYLTPELMQHFMRRLGPQPRL